MENSQENPRHVRSINNVVQGVDLTPNDAEYATFEQYRYFSGIRYDEPSLNKIPRELLDAELPSPLPRPPSKPPVVVEGVDHTPDDPNWATFYEYRFNNEGIRDSEPRCVKKPREGINVQMKITATNKIPGTAAMGLPLTSARKVVQKIACNPDHPQLSSLKDQSTYDIIETTKFSHPTDFGFSEKSSYDPYKSQPPVDCIPTAPRPAPTSIQLSPPPAPLPSVKLKMARNKKTIYKKGSCGKCSVILSQACRVHKAVLDSKDFVEELLRVIDAKFEDLKDLRIAWEAYDHRTVKELCAACSALHGRGLTKSSFQKEHNFLIESFYETVTDIKNRIGSLLDEVEADKENLMLIVNAARTLGVDRGEDDKGEMHLLSEDLFELYEEEMCALDEMEEEYKKDRPFLYMDEYRGPRMVQKAASAVYVAANEAELVATQATLDARVLELEETRAEHERNTKIYESRKRGLLARERCARRKLAAIEEAERMRRWQDEAIKIKLMALCEGGMDDGMDVMEEEAGGMGSVKWWMEMARNEKMRESDSCDLFGSTVTRLLLVRAGMNVDAEWGSEEFLQERMHL